MESNNVKKGKIFDHAYLEFLSKAPPRISALVYFFVIISMLIWAYRNELMNQPLQAAIIFLGSLIFWTLFEYIAHRYFFHLDEYFPHSKTAKRVSYIFHGIHHDYPRDTDRLIMPPIPGLLIISVLFTTGFILFDQLVFVALPGFLTGYLLYTYVHYKSHVTPVPTWLKGQYRHHALHHYKYPDKAFGVSSPLWDWVFGTMPPKK